MSFLIKLYSKAVFDLKVPVNFSVHPEHTHLEHGKRLHVINRERERENMCVFKHYLKTALQNELDFNTSHVH